MHQLTTLPLLLVLSVSPVPAPAQGVPPLINHEGLLLDDDGLPMEGNVTVRVALYDRAEGGDPLWFEEYQLGLVDGFYTVRLGEESSLEDVFGSGARYLGLSVNHGDELDPRQSLVSVPYSLVSENALGDITPHSIWVGGQQVIDEEGNWVGPPVPGAGDGVGYDTPEEVLAALRTVDGTGSLVDADALDGHDSSEFVRGAGQLLDLLTSVDGSGSGVDADRLDGLDSAQFVTEAGQVLNLLMTVDGPGSGIDADRLDGLDSSELLVDADRVLDLLKTVDGPGSGVDADRLDGLDSSQFMRTADIARLDFVNGPAIVDQGGRLQIHAGGGGEGDNGTASIYFLASDGEVRARIDTTGGAADCEQLPGGCGSDGDVSVNGTVNLSTTVLAPGRNCADAVRYASMANLASGSNSISLSSNPTANCLQVGDEVIIISLQGPEDAGRYEFQRVAQINGNVLQLRASLVNSYNGGNHKILVQRVPNYGNLTVEAGATLTANAWDGSVGGVLALRASGRVTVRGTIDMNEKGFGGGGGGSGGDGGGGGSIFLAAQDVEIGANRVVAAGGSGGSGGSGGPGIRGSGCGSQSTGGAGGNGAPGATGASGRVAIFGFNIAGSSSPAAYVDRSGEGLEFPAQNGYGTLYIGSTNTSAADLAEYYPAGDLGIEAGDVVVIRTGKSVEDGSGQGLLFRAEQPYEKALVGIISTRPGVLLGSRDGDPLLRRERSLALAGRVPVKVCSESGPIEVGDYLTSSSTPGVAMRSLHPGLVVGIALEGFEPQESEDIGKIEAFVRTMWVDPRTLGEPSREEPAVHVKETEELGRAMELLRQDNAALRLRVEEIEKLLSKSRP